MANALKHGDSYKKKVMGVIDHKLLKTFATEAEIKSLIDEAHALARNRQNRPKYNPERAEHLKMIEDQIKRGEEIG